MRFRLFPERLEKAKLVCEQGFNTNPPKKRDFSSLQFRGFEWDLPQKPENLRFWRMRDQQELFFGFRMLLKWSVLIMKQYKSC